MGPWALIRALFLKGASLEDGIKAFTVANKGITKSDGQRLINMYRDVQKNTAKVIEFPKDKITPFNKPRPGEGIAGIEQRAKKIEALNEKLKKFTVKPDFYETMFGKSPKKPTVVKDKTLLKDSPEAIAKIKADNKAAIKRLKDKKKTVEDFSEDGDFDPGGMASGGIAGQLHMNEGGRASFTKGGKVSSGLANILGV